MGQMNKQMFTDDTRLKVLLCHFLSNEWRNSYVSTTGQSEKSAEGATMPTVPPPASHVAPAESGWSAGPDPPLSPARPPSHQSSPSAHPHRGGTGESPWQHADSVGVWGQIVSIHGHL